jgi:hypothetical protein
VYAGCSASLCWARSADERRCSQAVGHVLSAEDDAAVKRVVLAAGAFAFIEKRTVATDLLPALRAACGVSRCEFAGLVIHAPS